MTWIALPANEVEDMKIVIIFYCEICETHCMNGLHRPTAPRGYMQAPIPLPYVATNKQVYAEYRQEGKWNTGRLPTSYGAKIAGSL